jgi:hypothetical protein
MNFNSIDTHALKKGVLLLAQVENGDQEFKKK